MSSTRPIRVTALRGHIIQGPYGKGSKSEHDTVFIETTYMRYILRRKTDSVFDDTKLKQYIGHDVECDGFLVGTTLLVERIEVVE